MVWHARDALATGGAVVWLCFCFLFRLATPHLMRGTCPQPFVMLRTGFDRGAKIYRFSFEKIQIKND